MEKNVDHKGPHLCEEKNHLCKEECDYFKKTKKEDGGCFGKCKFPAGHEGNSHYWKNEKFLKKRWGAIFMTI